jgi:Flp pilus assembly protein TadD
MSSDDVDRARLLLEEARPREARVLLRRRLAEDPDDLQALGLAAWAAELEDDHVEALRLVRRPLAARPDDLTLLGVLSWARSGVGDAEGAREAALRRCALAPGDWAALCDLAGIELRGGRHDDETLGAAREAVRLAPDQPSVRLRLGAVHLARHEQAAARREFEEALRLDPASREARHDLAIVDLRGGGVIRAAREFAALTVDGELGQAAAHNLGLAVQRGLWVVQVAIVIVATAVGLRESDLLSGMLAQPVRIVCAAVMVALTGFAVVYTRRRLGSATRGILRLFARTSRSMLVWVALMAASVVMIVVAAFVPEQTAGLLYDLVRVLSLAGFVIGAVHTATLRRREP